MWYIFTLHYWCILALHLTVIKSHNELLKISDKILSNLIKAQNELGIIISQKEFS